MRNVFEFAAKSNEFTPREKTLLGDIAMDFRDMGIHTRLELSRCSKSGLAQFFDSDTNRVHIYVTRHRDSGDGVVRYRVSPTNASGFDSINFPDVLKACRTHLESIYDIHPHTAQIVHFPARKFG